MADVKITKTKVTAALKALGIERGRDFESLHIDGEFVTVHRTLTDGSGVTDTTQYEIQ